MNEHLPKKFCDILNTDNGVIPGPIDLSSLWQLIPPEKPNPRNPKYSARFALLRTYVRHSLTKQWAREELRGLLRELLHKREPVPALLQGWALYQCATDTPKPSRGRPEEVDRNLRVCTIFVLMQRDGYSREAAFNLIAEYLVCAPETVRSIVRKWQSERGLPRPSGPCAGNRPAPHAQV